LCRLIEANVQCGDKLVRDRHPVTGWRPCLAGVICPEERDFQLFGSQLLRGLTGAERLQIEIRSHLLGVGNRRVGRVRLWSLQSERTKSSPMWLERRRQRGRRGGPFVGAHGRRIWKGACRGKSIARSPAEDRLTDRRTVRDRGFKTPRRGLPPRQPCLLCLGESIK